MENNAGLGQCGVCQAWKGTHEGLDCDPVLFQPAVARILLSGRILRSAIPGLPWRLASRL